MATPLNVKVRMIAPCADGNGVALILREGSGQLLVLTLEPTQAIKLADMLQSVRPLLATQAAQKEAKETES